MTTNCFPPEFPECGCHYTTDDDGIHFCPMHHAAPEMLKALEYSTQRGFDPAHFHQLIKSALKKAGRWEALAEAAAKPPAGV